MSGEAIYIQKPPTVRIDEDGFAHIEIASGKTGFHFVMSISDLRKSVQAANRALDAAAEARGQVLPFKGRKGRE